MKKIVVLRNTGARLPRFTEGQVVDVEDEVAELLCGLQLATLLPMSPIEPLRAVPDNPSIVAAEAHLKEFKEAWLGEEPQPPPKRSSKSKTESKE